MTDPRLRTDDPAVLATLAADLADGAVPSLIEAALEPGQVWLTLQGPSAPLQLLIEPRDEARPRFTRSAHLNVSYAADELPDGGRELVERTVVALGSVHFEELATLLRERIPPRTEPGEDGEASGRPREDPLRERMRSLAGLWGRDVLWDQFLAERTRQGAEVKLASPSAVVMHGEYECCFVHGEVPGVGHQPFLESRWSALPYPAAPGSSSEAGHAAYFTDLTEGDAIQGRGRARLQGILDELADDPDRFAVCHFNATCVPTVLHDDSTGLLARFRDRSALPVYHVTEERPSATASLVPLLRHRLAGAAPAAGADPATAVNLVGYAEDERGEDLTGLLARVGVRVNLSVLPVIDLADLDRVGAAGCQVFRPDGELEDLYAPFRELPLTAVDAAAPYGPIRTGRWLAAIGDALGCGDDVRARWADLWGKTADEWDGARARAAGHTLLLVLRLDQLARLGEFERCHAVPLIPALDEMGFQLALAIPAAGHDPAELLERAGPLWASQADRPPVQRIAIEDEGELRDLLRNGAFSAALSDLRFDSRLSAAGIGRFSSSDLRMGPDGALATLRRLLRICELPFTRRYARFLGGRRTADGG